VGKQHVVAALQGSFSIPISSAELGEAEDNEDSFFMQDLGDDGYLPGNWLNVDGNRAVWKVAGFIVAADLEMRSIVTCSLEDFKGEFLNSCNMVLYSSTRTMWVCLREIFHEATRSIPNTTGAKHPFGVILRTQGNLVVVGSKETVYIMLNKQEEGRCCGEALRAETGEKIWFVEWRVSFNSVRIFNHHQL